MAHEPDMDLLKTTSGRGPQIICHRPLAKQGLGRRVPPEVLTCCFVPHWENSIASIICFFFSLSVFLYLSKRLTL